jgi:hypothetical protein
MDTPEGSLIGNGGSRPMRSVEAAAVAGVLYSVLTIAALVALSRFPSLALSDEAITAWFDDTEHQATLILGLNLAALSSVAFLWFVAVIRRRLGDREDRFFATVFRGSAIVYVTLWLTGAAATAAPAVAMTTQDDGAMGRETATLASGFAAAILLVVVPRIQAVFVFSTSTLFLRTGALPKWVSYIGYLTGAVLFVFPLVFEPLGIALPVWVFVVSVVILVIRRNVAS